MRLQTTRECIPLHMNTHRFFGKCTYSPNDSLFSRLFVKSFSSEGENFNIIFGDDEQQKEEKIIIHMQLFLSSSLQCSSLIFEHEQYPASSCSRLNGEAGKSEEE